MSDLPAALVEETFCPEQVVAVAEDDGTTRLMLYAGRHGDGYIFLRHVILRPEHAAGLIAGVEAEPPEGVDDSDDTLDLPGDTWPANAWACGCGSPRLPSGWCTSGHAPRA